MDGWNASFLLKKLIFRGYVSFRECIFEASDMLLPSKTCSTHCVSVHIQSSKKKTLKYTVNTITYHEFHWNSESNSQQKSKVPFTSKDYQQFLRRFFCKAFPDTHPPASRVTSKRPPWNLAHLPPQLQV